MVLNKNNIMKITTIMIILLVIALIFIFMHYLSFRDDVVVKKPVTTPIKTNSGEIKNLEHSGESKAETIESGEPSLVPSNPEDNNSESKVEDKGSKDNKNNKENNDKIQKEDEAPKNNQVSNDNKVENNNVKDNTDNSTQMPNTIIDVTDNNMQEPVITSDINTSNQEKQQVLNELDDALKGLLEVVGKVPTVDENKLDASLESEVQP